MTAKYFIEIPVVGERRMEYVVAQDATGIYRSIDSSDDSIIQIREPEMTFAWLVGWGRSKAVSTTSWDYLEFVRLWERNSYMTSRPTVIRTMGGSAIEVVWRVMNVGPGREDLSFDSRGHAHRHRDP